MSQAITEPPPRLPASGAQVRAHASQLTELAARYGITELAFASAGKLRGRIDDEHDLFDMFEFQRAATDLIGADVVLFSVGALRNENVSPDLRSAAPL
ncbi:hypothetical protein [[Mycobacterium] zoologicum]|uniref:hypothetical protein n=1 Tax=[Mycobacterium] zoologicum TaxID=2872311 RepID=UPI001CDAC6BD|nr:hypothetical protein [Mycolicibacter sp. MYC101]MEB3062613.1 hypothetical protein [Mycolicibacter sp. MYC101]